ncbi:MAG: hypothetical protein Q9178_005900 [Gyalolechia marmorata]
MVYANPGGFNFGATNLDGYGISLLAFIVVYTLLLYAACIYLWLQRHHPIVRMRKVGLMLLSVLVIHVFCFMDFSVYTMNGRWPCNVEFWSMSLYLPIGIGLWQAQNQQLIIVSREQTEMRKPEYASFKPLLPPRGRGMGTPTYWLWRFKIWYRSISTQGKYEGFVLFGIVIQTIIAIVAGLPGTPLWFAAVYTNKFAPINKYWLPSMWLAPGMLAMEIVTVVFPIYQILKHKRAAREIRNALASFDQKRLESSHDSITLGSSARTGSVSSSKKKTYSAKALDECLTGNPEQLQIYASCRELNGENIIFLTQVIFFRHLCQKLSASVGVSVRRARLIMFQKALAIYLTLVHSSTAHYSINIESPIYNRLRLLFSPATAVIATYKASRRTSSLSLTNTSSATPWEDHEHHELTPPGMIPSSGSDSSNKHHKSNSRTQDLISIPLRSLPSRSKYISLGNSSSDHIVSISEREFDSLDPDSTTGIQNDPFDNLRVPADFDATVFDAAYESVRYMVYTGIWQRYCAWRIQMGLGGIGPGL